MVEDLLGEYLRARRARLRPHEVGLHEHGPRRVPGLRREEVALLAGISADYYLRLEQGRGGRPSEQVLSALARVLRLDATGSDHLLELASSRSAPPAPAGTPEQVPHSVLNLLAVLDLPAFVTGRTFDVLAANTAARALSPELAAGRNRLRSLFLVEAERELYEDWEATAQRFVALVREAVGRSAADSVFAGLVEELISGSARFAELWTRHDVLARDTEVAVFRHPVVGRLQLHLERLDVTGVPGQGLVVYHPEAGSKNGSRLARLLGEETGRKNDHHLSHPPPS